MNRRPLQRSCILDLAGLLFEASALAAEELVRDRNVKLSNSDVRGQENAVLTQVPHMSPSIARRTASKVIVHLEVHEVINRLADGVAYVFSTFGGDMPGSFIRVRERDEIKCKLNSLQDNIPQNIDRHAVTDPGGGAKSFLIAPGHSSQLSFKAPTPGLFFITALTAQVRARNEGL